MSIKKIATKYMTAAILSTTMLLFTGESIYENTNNLIFNNINIEKGISQSTIEAIFQDSKGYIWLGTNDGLNRYNGYDFKIYNYEEGQNSITNNWITDINEDVEGNIWVSTLEGINKIDPKTGEISNYLQGDNNMTEECVTKILITKDKKILVATYNGLYSYNKEKDIFDNVLNTNSNILSDNIYSIDEDKNSDLWIATERGVNKLSKDFKVLETYPTNSDENSLGDTPIYNIYCDNKHSLVWVGSSSSGLFKIDINTKKVTRYINDPDDKNSISCNQIGSIMRDSNDNLWVGTHDGLAKYNQENDNFIIYKNKIYDKNSLVYNDVSSLFEDREGIIWVGTYSGISLFDTKSSIKYYNSGVDEGYLLNENMIHGVYEDGDGYLWVGTKSKGINIIDRKNNTSYEINKENNDVIKSNSINDITGYKNFIFVATDSGLLKIDKNNKTIRNYDLQDNLIGQNIKDIFLDNQNHLWIGTISGLNILDTENDKIIDMTKYIKKGSYVRYIYQGKNKNYYIGFLKDGGLSVINTTNNTIKNYKHVKGDTTSISSNNIKCINEDSKGNIWIGTNYGLNKFDINTKKFKRYTIQDGLPNNTIYGVLVDDEDNIWISTNKGISKINQNDNTINNLCVTDGLQGNEFNGNASFKSKSGELFFGGTNGLNSFFPKDISAVSNKSQIVFDGFEVSDKEYTDINNLRLSSHTHTIKIKFFTPLYSSNKNITYEYRLKGANASISKTKENYVTYTDLSPGKYTFEIRAVDSRGYVSDTASTTFYIKPPFWRSPLAIIIYIIIILLFIIRHKQQLRKLDDLVKKKTNKLQEQMKENEILYNKNIKIEENKNNYLVNLSHELRTPLNVISSTNQLLYGLSKKNTVIDNEHLIEYIDMSQRNCKRLLKLVNNILDNTKLQSNMYTINLKEVDIVYLVEETVLNLSDYIQSKGIELIIDPEIEEKTILCDDYEIERCITNLVSNAIKFTPEGGNITVRVKDLEDKVMISVSDTGAGIDKKYHETIFDRFNQVEDEQSKIKVGSGLGLTITSKIVDLHKGEIYVESELGEGSNFVIILPVNPN